MRAALSRREMVRLLGLGAVALGRGVMEHGYVMPASMGAFGLGIMAGAMTLPHESGGGAEALWTVIGVGLLAFLLPGGEAGVDVAGHGTPRVRVSTNSYSVGRGRSVDDSADRD